MNSTDYYPKPTLGTVFAPLRDTVARNEGITDRVKEVIKSVIGPDPTMDECYGPGCFLYCANKKFIYYGHDMPTTEKGIEWDNMFGPDAATHLGTTEKRLDTEFNAHHKYYIVFTGKKGEWDYEVVCPEDCPARKGGKACKGANAKLVPQGDLEPGMAHESVLNGRTVVKVLFRVFQKNTPYKTTLATGGKTPLPV